jgi:mevalonate kinase
LWFVRQGEVIEDLPDFLDCVLIVGYSGSKADTKSMIADVAKKRASDPQKVDRIFEAIGTLVAQGKEAYVAGDWARLGTYMNFNQEYLRDLGVSTEKLEALIAAAKKAGAWGAKLSGAGGGDCMIAIAPSDKREAIEQALTHAGGEVVHVLPHEPGVRIE